jgi:hypothetical protein
MGERGWCQSELGLELLRSLGDGSLAALYERDGFLRAGDHTEATGLARVGVGRVGSVLAMDPKLESCEGGEGLVFAFVDGSDLEYAVGADGDAVRLAFAATAIDFRLVSAGCGAAEFAGAARFLGGEARLVAVERRVLRDLWDLRVGHLVRVPCSMYIGRSTRRL